MMTCFYFLVCIIIKILVKITSHIPCKDHRLVKTSRRSGLTGLENISAHNGWAMAAVGISIVFSGLILLSFVISQLHRILALFERWYIRAHKKNHKNLKKADEKCDTELPATMTVDKTTAPHKMTDDKQLFEVIRNYKLITHRIGEPFSLPKLLDLAEKRGLNKPYSTVNMLIASEDIVPDDNGFFVWKH